MRIAERSYFCIERSKRSASIFSLAKYLTVSKFSRLSMALLFASVSLSFMSRRIAMRQFDAFTVNQR
jgi:hypothetical protein